VVVGVGHVELAHGELGVVRHVDALVAEVAADLVDPVDAAHHQHLQVQLGRDPHEQVHVQVVVVGDEGLGGGAARDHVHERGLDLEEAQVVEERAQVLDDLGLGHELLLHLVVHHQVQVALSVAGLLVLEAVVHVRHLVEAGRQDGDLDGPDAQLAGLGAAGLAAHAHDVAELDAVHDREVGLALVEARVGHDLDLVRLAAQVEEAQLLAHGALRVDAAGHGDHVVAHLLVLQGRVLVDEGRHGDLDVELVRVDGALAVLFLHCVDHVDSVGEVFLW